MRRVGIVGCGTIGTALARVIDRDYRNVAKVTGLVDSIHTHARALQQTLRARPPIVTLTELIRRSHIIVEAASASIADRVARLALAAHRDVLIMSAGGLLARGAGWRAIAKSSRGHLYVPSGGLCGIDGIKAMAIGTIRRIQLTTRKPPKALASAPFVQARRLRLDRLRAPRTIFRGTAAEAVTAFPQNTNIAATVTLACALHSPAAHPAVTTIVRVVADPTIRLNVHELEFEGDCGTISCRLENQPSALNPKTSELAVRSAIATMRQLFEPVRVGT